MRVIIKLQDKITVSIVVVFFNVRGVNNYQVQHFKKILKEIRTKSQKENYQCSTNRLIQRGKINECGEMKLINFALTCILAYYGREEPFDEALVPFVPDSLLMS